MDKIVVRSIDGRWRFSSMAALTLCCRSIRGCSPRTSTIQNAWPAGSKPEEFFPGFSTGVDQDE